MKIICGLGNPGRQYEGHRHNAGFLALDAFASRFKVAFTAHKFEAELAQLDIGGLRLLLLKPQTFMNLSGTSLAGAARFYKVAPSDVLVVHDELDLPFGRLQLKEGGGTGGHNGLSSIRDAWGEEGYGRLRFGIGRPQGSGARDRVVGHVLSDFSAEERHALPSLLTLAAESATAWARDGMQRAMNAANRRTSASEVPPRTGPG
jgi:PTH1 family peptidyl-tRNA hydrolase